MENIFSLVQVSWIAVLVATLVCSVLGGVWFGALFSKQYSIFLGKDPKIKLEMSTLSYVGPMIATFVTATATSLLVGALGVTTISEAILLGIFVGVGYVTTTLVTVAINPNFPQPLKYACLNAPYFILCNIIIASLIVLI